MIIFLSKTQVLNLHATMIDLYGGATGNRDEGLLDSALDAPKASFGGEFLYKTVPEITAVYLFHLCQNHAFIDGNKRVASGAAMIFCELNGWECTLTNHELEELTLEVAAGEIPKAALSKVFEKRLTPPGSDT